MNQLAKLSFLLATIIGFCFNFEALISNGDINWISWLITYVVCFAFFYFYVFTTKSKDSEEYMPESNSSVNPTHVEALYKQSMIVERNAKKANLVLSQQLVLVKNILNKTKDLNENKDLSKSFGLPVKELEVLDHNLERLLCEMKKNVRLGEKLQQSVANIDPEIGVA
jgi:Ca2+/Na+ antiporter